jgi:Ca-activated chloride channel family protein
MRKILLLFSSILAIWSGAEGFGLLKARSPGTNEGFVPLWLKLMNAQVVINDQIAITTVDQTFKNMSSARKEGIYEFSLPDGARIIELALWINGTRCVAQAYEKTSAKSTYDSTVRKTVDPALLEQTGDNTYTVNIFPIEANGDSMSERRIDFTYIMALEKTEDTIHFPFQLKTTGFSSLAPQSALLNIQTALNDTIGNILVPNFSPTEYTITRPSLRSFTMTHNDINAFCSKDMLLKVLCPPKSITMDALSYNSGIDTTMYFDSTGDPGYFLVRVNTPAPFSVLKPRNLVIVFDASYSMRDTNITLVKKAAIAAMNVLTSADYFNIISFGTHYTLFDSVLNVATTTNINSAVSFINNVAPKGITNPVDALTKAFSTAWNADTNRAVLFMTDGFPIWPVRRSTSSLIDTITAHNSGMVRLYSIAIGRSTDQQFLSLLSQRNSGYSVWIQPEDTAFTQLRTIVAQMAFPRYTNINLNFGSMAPIDVFPAFPQTLIAGHQFNVYGRYRTAITTNIIFSAQTGGQSVYKASLFTFPVTNGNNHVLPQLWASSKIDALLDTIKIKGETSLIVKQITALGLRYHIVTPYTSLLVLIAAGGGVSILDNMNKQKIEKPSLFLVYHPQSSKIRIDYSVPTKGSIKNVSIKIYDIRGKLVRTVVKDKTAGGHFVVLWDRSTDSGSLVCPGYYIVVLDVDNQRFVNSLKIIR